MKFKSVFDCYPDVDVIHVVGDMPFLKAGEAQAYAISVNGTTQVVTRASQYESAAELEPFTGDVDPLAAAEQAKAKQEADELAAAEQAKAKQEADELAAAEQAAAEQAATEKPKGKGNKKK
jgi:hypothetical protein